MHLRSEFLFLLSCALLVATAAQAHGIPANIGIDGSNKLFSHERLIYDADESALLLTGTGVKGAIGVYPEFGVFPTGQALTVSASGSPLHATSLMYWDGAQLLSSPENVVLSRTGISATIAPTDTFVPVGTLPPYNGALGGHSALTITLPTTAPLGLYAIGLQVANPNYTGSDTFWTVGNYGLTDPASIAAGLAAFQAQVPEPSCLALAASGVLTVLVVVRQRRRASR